MQGEVRDEDRSEVDEQIEVYWQEQQEMLRRRKEEEEEEKPKASAAAAAAAVEQLPAAGTKKVPEGDV